MWIEKIKEFPKVELHCHLDGSLSPELLRNLGMELPENNLTAVSAPVPCHSLTEYLQCFGNVLPFLQTEENLRKAACDVIRQGARDKVIYMEVRFAPGLHGKNGLTQQQVCRAVLQGLEEGEKLYGVKSRAILCLMRGKSQEYNQTTMETAGELLSYGVGGIDLAGAEDAYPVELYRGFFEKAYEKNIPFTIHAGECGNAQNVKIAIELGARRIGHGVAIADDEQIKAMCRERRICLELCPVSNLQTRAVEKISDYPFLRFRREGLAVTVHTDNRTVSGTTLEKEWKFLSENFSDIKESDFWEANLDGVKGAFLPENEKKKLAEEFRRG